MEEKGKLAILAAIAGALLLLFVRIGATPLLDREEARFARTSVEMMRSGDYVVPTFEGVPRLVSLEVAWKEGKDGGGPERSLRTMAVLYGVPEP